MSIEEKEQIIGDWVYGSYAYWNDNTGNPMKHTIKERHYIYTYCCLDFNLGGWDMVEVDPETVGQYVGLKDRNGKKIYEGDILLAPVWLDSVKCVCIYQQENIVSSIQGFGLYSYDNYFRKYKNLVESDEWDEFEVIGNVWEDGGLLDDSKNTKAN